MRELLAKYFNNTKLQFLLIGLEICMQQNTVNQIKYVVVFVWLILRFFEELLENTVYGLHLKSIQKTGLCLYQNKLSLRFANNCL